jgi:citrate lyase subunit beta/citryl-CoA lyase
MQTRPPEGWTVAELRLLRALLFAPGSDPRKLSRALGAGADLAVIDLEDAVADSEKQRARELTAKALAGQRPGPVAVRVNGWDTGALVADLEAVAPQAPDAVLLPKVHDAQELPRLDLLLSEHERRLGLAQGAIAVIALIEDAYGLCACEQIALSAPSRVLTLAFGIGDFAVDLGLDPSRELDGLRYARSRIVVAARAGGLAPPVDGPFLDLGDERGRAADSRLSRGLGFGGRVVVHPAQLASVFCAYSELEPERERFLRRVVEAFEQAEREGCAAITVDGRFVDYPIYELARRSLAAQADMRASAESRR